MTNRTIILISLLIAVAMVAATFMIFYQSQTNALIEQYIAKISVCGNITDEKVCRDKSFCKGIYGPSCPGCADSVFLECKKINDAERARIMVAKNLCLATAGTWQLSIKGDYCSCQSGMMYNSVKGCVDKK